MQTWLSRLRRDQYCNFLAVRSFFDGSLVNRKNVSWLLLLTIPNSGSTALAKMLLTAPNTFSLSDRAEGQWLIPSLCKTPERWSPDYRVWGRKIRATWLSAIGKGTTSPILVVEKSPPNLCRFQSLITALGPMQTHVATLSRDPYATCSSWSTRYGPRILEENWGITGAKSLAKDLRYFSLLGEIWLERARMLLEARRFSTIDIRYEDFTNDVSATVRQLETAIPGLRDISVNARIQVKDYGEQRISNMNDRQIGRLTADQIDAISLGLSSDADTVRNFGYSIR